MRNIQLLKTINSRSMRFLNRQLKRMFVVCCFALVPSTVIADSVKTNSSIRLFPNTQFGSNDAVLVRELDGASAASGKELFSWQKHKQLIPASVQKLLTAYLAIVKWGANHRFTTGVYQRDEQLWIKGSGDPYLISEELDILVEQLQTVLHSPVSAIYLDAQQIATEPTPGRSQAADPYNAPLSAIAANFNTVMLKRQAGRIVSAEAQTPLTTVANQLAQRIPASSKNAIGTAAHRVNLVDAERAQRHFGQILAAKLNARQNSSFQASGKESGKAKVIKSIENSQIFINQHLPQDAELILEYKNSHTLAEMLRGTLEFSNNFIANQIFLKLAENNPLGHGRTENNAEQTNKRKTPSPLTFADAISFAESQVKKQFSWRDSVIADGAGLSRKNRISAAQLAELLIELAPNQHLLKRYELGADKGRTGAYTKDSIYAHAKTGTLNGVRSFAGYLHIGEKQFHFVFLFNRKTPYKYREQLLQELSQQLLKYIAA